MRRGTDRDDQDMRRGPPPDRGDRDMRSGPGPSGRDEGWRRGKYFVCSLFILICSLQS